MPSHVRMAALVAGIAAVAACAADPEEARPARAREALQEPASWDDRAVLYADPASRWRFDVLPAPFRVDATRFDPSTPPNQVKQRFELKDDKRLLVRVDVYANPEGSEVAPWMDSHLSYLQKGQPTFSERLVGPSRARGVVIDTPRSCQAANIVTAVFALDGHIVAVTCADGEDAVAKRAFDALLSSFGREGVR